MKTADPDFRDFFLQTGPDGLSGFKEAMGFAVQQLEELLGECTQSYSGLDPNELWHSIRTSTAAADGRASLQEAINRATQQVARHSIVVQHPHCIAHLHTPPLLAGIVAELFIATLNQSMDSWDQASSATFVELEVIKRITGWFNLPKTADGVFTGGATQSNLMGLLVARDAVCRKRFGLDVRRDGLTEDCRRLRILVSDVGHFSVAKAAAQLGLGESAVQTVPADEDGRMSPEALQSALRQLQHDGLVPLAIVGTAGTTDHGAIDPLSAIAELARTHNAWFHVDAAYGGGLILSQASQRLDGIERADSVAVDFHKFFYQPISCGAFLLGDGGHFGHIEHHADYLNRVTDPFPNLVDRSLATTRRFDALKVWMTLQCVSESQLGGMVDRAMSVAQFLANQFDNDPEFELVVRPQLSTVLFRHPESDDFNRQLRLDLLTSGQAVLGETVIDSRVTLKLTILNPCLTNTDCEQLLAIIRRSAINLQSQQIPVENI